LLIDNVCKPFVARSAKNSARKVNPYVAGEINVTTKRYSMRYHIVMSRGRKVTARMMSNICHKKGLEVHLSVGKPNNATMLQYLCSKLLAHKSLQHLQSLGFQKVI